MKGKPTPFWDTRPILKPWLAQYYEAFWMLSKGRGQSANGTVAPLKISEMQAFLSLQPYFEPGRFIRCMQAMDVAFIEHLMKKD